MTCYPLRNKTARTSREASEINKKKKQCSLANPELNTGEVLNKKLPFITGRLINIIKNGKVECRHAEQAPRLIRCLGARQTFHLLCLQDSTTGRTDRLRA